jgi:GTP-binding protein
LIEGAASGAGLGHEFLRHVERTRLLIHLIDGTSSQPLEDWAMINQELTLHNARLEAKPQIVVLNKIDLPDAQRWENNLQENMLEAGLPFFSISAVTGQGVSDLLFHIKRMVDELPEAVPLISDGTVIIRPAPDDDAFIISKEHDGWRIQGKRIERIAAMTYWEFEATTMRFQQILESMGITAALEDAGVMVGDTVYIGDETLEWQE